MIFFLNGIEKNYSGDPETSLLQFLRGDEHITSPKDACSGQGICGACSVEVDGVAVLSCRTPMKKVEGKRVLTIEGWEARVQEIFSRAFALKGGVQCGHCLPGIVVTARSFLTKNPNPSRAEVKKAINRHLCRCTGYKKIIDSILYAAAILREDVVIPNMTFPAHVGSIRPKNDARNLVLGKSKFTADLMEKGMLFGALKFSDHPKAKILTLDISEAKQHPGVVRVFTATDIPGDRITGLIIPDWPLMIGVGEETRYTGDVLAGVVAETEVIAREAIKKIKISYDVLTPVSCPFEAMKPTAPLIHPDGNILSLTKLRRGDVEKAIRESAFISEGTYTTQRIEHGFIEVESCLAKPWNKGVEVFSQGQGAYEDRKQIAKLLGLKVEEVNVHQVPNGGAFGGKEDISVQGHAALFAHLLRRPVKVTFTREESLNFHPKRHPMTLKYKLGCDKKGNLTFLTGDIVGDSGAYASVGMKVLERAAGHATSAYHVPIVDITATAVYTNNVPCGAMRGFGVNQTAFAMEGCIEDLCMKGGFDRFDFRFNNALKEGDTLPTGQVLKQAVGVRPCLLAIKDVFKKAKYAGIATAIKNCGIGNGMADIGRAKITIHSEKQITVHHGWTEMGQGAHTIALQVFCEETRLDPAIVTVRVETKEDVVCGMTTSSRGTSLIGHAVKKACEKLKDDLKKSTLSQLAGKEYRGEWRCDWTTPPGEEVKNKEACTHYSYSYAAQVAILNDKGKIEKIVAAHDAGRIMNPLLFEGQIEGSVHMGLGYALTEDFPVKDSKPVHLNLGKCGIIRAQEMPDVEVIGLEIADPDGPYGAKGIGEIGLIPTAPAVAGALYAFDKIKRYSLPLGKNNLL
jgi:selenium-dependent xanthine dehydrogenase